MGQDAPGRNGRPPEDRLRAVADVAIHPCVRHDLRAEPSVFRQGKGGFGYEMVVLQRD